MSKMKIFKGTSFLAYAVLLVIVFVVLSMFYTSWVGEHDAKIVCNGIDLEKPFDAEKSIQDRKPMLVKREQGNYYTYLFFKGYLSTAECRVFVNEGGVVVKKEMKIISD